MFFIFEVFFFYFFFRMQSIFTYIVIAVVPDGRLNIKMSYQYRDPHVKHITWESPYLGKTVFILRWDPVLLATCIYCCYIFAINITFRPEENVWHFADIFKCIYLFLKIYIFFIEISLWLVPDDPFTLSSSIQIMVWHSFAEPFSEPMLTKFYDAICCRQAKLS